MLTTMDGYRDMPIEELMVCIEDKVGARAVVRVVTNRLPRQTSTHPPTRFGDT
jgi:hypothetical protein